MIIIVIKVIFMNLLIAIMNTTMQEVHDKKLLYWKFVRAGISLMMTVSLLMTILGRGGGEG